MFYGIHYASPVGNLLLVSDGEKITGLWMENQKYIKETMPQSILQGKDIVVLKQGRQWLDRYFAGERPDPCELPLAPQGNEFRQLVWKKLLMIPYGQLTTYGEIAESVARQMGKPHMSAQAVGGAVGHNPIGIMIPCHRVVGANGNLTGYAEGIEKKIALLRHEGINMENLFFRG